MEMVNINRKNYIIYYLLIIQHLIKPGLKLKKYFITRSCNIRKSFTRWYAKFILKIINYIYICLQQIVQMLLVDKSCLKWKISINR